MLSPIRSIAGPTRAATDLRQRAGRPDLEIGVAGADFSVDIRVPASAVSLRDSDVDVASAVDDVAAQLQLAGKWG